MFAFLNHHSHRAGRRQSVMLAWLLVCAMMLQMLVPTMARAGQASPLAVQLCSAHGTKTVYIDAQGNYSAVPQQSGNTDCRCCLVGAVAPPAAISFGEFLSQHNEFVLTEVVLNLAPTDAAFVWLSRLKQAPPAYS